MNSERISFLRASCAVAALIMVTILISSCTGRDSYYIAGTADQKKELRLLFNFLAEEHTAGENRFIILSQIARILSVSGEAGRMNLFLTSYVENNPQDSFNAYYLLLVARNHKKQKAFPLAAYYYEQILRNHPDLLLQGESVHLTCLRELIKLVDTPGYRVEYYKELLSRFSGKIDTGVTWFSLAKTYEQIGEWDQALLAYTRFLNSPQTTIIGFPDAFKEANNLLSFNNSTKSWTMKTLDDLVRIITTAIANRDARTLEKYRAKVNFFSMSWEQEETDANSQVVFDLGTFLRSSKVFYARELDSNTSAKEAYLKTWGWSYRIPTWYLYFRKIYFPADPEINGRWEWAGIYFGEKL